MRELIRSVTLNMTVVGVALVLALGSCSKRDVPPASDSDALIDNISTAYECTELFATDSLINPHRYQIFGDAAWYRDSVLSVTRRIDLALTDTTIEYPSYGWVREAVARVSDLFEVSRLRMASDTTEVIQDRTLVRHGHFLKLGSDNQEYLGWLLWGFDGVGVTEPPLQVTVNGPGGVVIPAGRALYTEPSVSGIFDPNLRFVRIRELDTLDNGSRVIISGAAPGAPIAYQMVLSAIDTNGYRTQAPIRQVTNQFTDTLKIALENIRKHNLIHVQVFREDDTRWLRSWVIPYLRPLD